MMKIKLLPFFLLLLQLGACSSDFDERIYGTWIDLSKETESLVFREDGTVNWFGDEGTFEQYTYDCAFMEMYCSNFNGVAVSLDNRDRDIYLSFHGLEKYQNSWWVNLGARLDRNDKIEGFESTDADSIHLFREGSFESPIMPAHFERLGEGRGLPKNTGYKDSYSYFESTSSRAFPVSVSPLLVGTGRRYDLPRVGNVWSYNETTNTWDTEIEGAGWYHFGEGIVINAANHEVSTDKGVTWTELPQLNYGHYAVAGTTVIKSVRTNSRETYNEPDEYELWTIDAAAPSPSWVQRSSFSIYARSFRDIYAHPTAGIIVWNAYYDDQNHAQLSTDFGTTWSSFNYPCDDLNVVIPHDTGLLCVNQEGDVLWYNSTNNTWTTHHVNFDDVVSSGDPTDGAYIRRGDQLIKWQPNGTETFITTVSGSLGYGDIYVFDDQIIVSKLGLWRTWR